MTRTTPIASLALTPADTLTYFTDVLHRLYDLHAAAPEGSSLYQITQEAGADIANLLGHLHVSSLRMEGGMEAVRMDVTSGPGQQSKTETLTVAFADLADEAVLRDVEASARVGRKVSIDITAAIHSGKP